MNTYHVSMTYRTPTGFLGVSREVQGLDATEAAKWAARQYPGEDGQTLIICGATEISRNPIVSRLAEMAKGGTS